MKSSSQQYNPSPKTSRETNRRATAGHERREGRLQKTYGTKASQEDSDFYRHSHEETNDRDQEPPKPADDPTASRVEAMLSNYQGGDDLLSGNLTLGSFPSIHTSIPNSVTPKTPRAADVQGSQRSQQSTIPTVADTLSSTYTDGHTTGSSERIPGETVQDATSSSRTPDDIKDTSQKRFRKRSLAAMEMDYENSQNKTRPSASQTSALSNAREQSVDIFDELASTGSKLSSTAKRKVSKLSKKTELVSSNQPDELGADDTELALPKEQHQPRPSRSRSGRNEEELFVPENFSKRPEVLAKKKANKRRKTTALARANPKVEIEDDEEDEDPIILPARKTDTANGKKVNAKGDVEPMVLIPVEKVETKKTEETTEVEEVGVPAEVDDTVIQEDPAPEKAPPSSPPKKKRGRPKKSIPEPATDRTETDLDDDLPDPETLTKAAPKKAGRKKRKVDEPSPAILDEHADTDNDAAAPPSEDVEKHLSHTEGNRQPTTTSITTATTSKGAEDLVKPHTPPQTPQKTANKGPDKHSPLNSGKIKYRVGLSKRQRIQPLLKIVKK